MKRLSQQPPVLKPPRHRAEDTGGFKRSALKITRRAATMPALQILPVLWDTLDWLRQWDCCDAIGMDDLSQDCARPGLHQHSCGFSPQP